MTSVLNSPIEMAIRVLTLLEATYPDELDTNRLVLLDYGLLHSADLGGPPNLNPTLPIRAGELGVKRQLIDNGLNILVKAGLVAIRATENGICFQAGESASGFVALLATPYAQGLKARATWLAENFSSADDDVIRDRMKAILGTWVEEFERIPHALSGGD